MSQEISFRRIQMIVEATMEQIAFVREYLKPGWIQSKEDFKGNDLKRFQGMMGQIVLSDFLGLERPINEGIDKGFDIEWKGKKWDVKTEIRTVPFLKTKYRHNVNGKQITNMCDGYIFISYNCSDGSFYLCGYITKGEFLKNAIYYKPGSKIKRTDGSILEIQGNHGMWEIEDKHLTKWTSEKN